MRLSGLRIKNFRSIVDTGEFRLERFQALVGGNNAGKSNILTAIEVFLTSGAGGVELSDFNNQEKPIVIAGTFVDLDQNERMALRPYLLGGKLIVEKRLELGVDERTGKQRVISEYHGYAAEPKEWWLSVEGVISQKGQKPKWEDVARDHNILEYVATKEGSVTKASYQKGVARLLTEKDDIEYNEPKLGETKALGLQPVLLSHLPKFFLLAAITDYADEIDKRSSSTVFRQLMADLADRIMKQDPRYKELAEAIDRVRGLLNPPIEKNGEAAPVGRLEILRLIEEELATAVKCVMPSVKGVRLEVTLDQADELVSRGVKLGVDDGKMTDVLCKGHGLQRCVVFGLLRTLIRVGLGEFEPDSGTTHPRPIILAIEEPELYIHPQLQRLIYSVLSSTSAIFCGARRPVFLGFCVHHTVFATRAGSAGRASKLRITEFSGVFFNSPSEKWQKSS
jgi:hypothetical protein